MKRGSSGHRFQVTENRIEPFDVTDLQDAVVLLGKLDQLSRLGSVVGHRLLDQHVFTLLKQQSGEFIVSRRRCYDAEPIARRGGFGNGIESLQRPVFLRDLARGVRDHIHVLSRAADTDGWTLRTNLTSYSLSCSQTRGKNGLAGGAGVHHRLRANRYVIPSTAHAGA